MSLQSLSATDVQIAFADYLRFRRENEGLSREKLSEKSEVPPSTIKKFERTGKISFYQLLLLWQALDELTLFYNLSQHQRLSKTIPTSISEVSQAVILTIEQSNSRESNSGENNNRERDDRERDDRERDDNKSTLANHQGDKRNH